MSTARFDQDERTLNTGPRCPIEIARKPHKGYSGTVRAPLLADERGAINVVELLFGGERLAFFRIPGDSDHAEIRRLPAVHKE